MWMVTHHTSNQVVRYKQVRLLPIVMGEIQQITVSGTDLGKKRFDAVPHVGIAEANAGMCT